jgi:ribonuclease III family protein
VNSKEEELVDGQDETPRRDLSCSQLQLVTKEQLPQQISPSQLRQISPTALAYLGDAVYELHVRISYLLPPQRPETYHRLVVEQVRAETQAKMLRELTPHLSENELDIVRRGRNAASGRPKRLDPETYQHATSLETLIGYLYLSDRNRLAELLQKIHLGT